MKYCIEYMNLERDTIIFGPFWSLDRADKKAYKMMDRQLKFQLHTYRKGYSIYSKYDNSFVCSYIVRKLK